MPRINDAETLATLEPNRIEFYDLVYVTIPNQDDIAVTNAPYNITNTLFYSGIGTRTVTYLSLGALLGFSDINENSEFEINEVTISLSGIPQRDNNNKSILPYILKDINHSYSVWIFRAMFVNGKPTDNVFLIFSGFTVGNSIASDPDNGTVIAVKCSNDFKAFDKRSGRHTTRAEAYLGFDSNDDPGQIDKFFDYAPQTILDVKWTGA